MDSEDIGLDFDCDISPEKPNDEVWHSESDHSTNQSGSEASDAPSDPENDAEKQGANTTVRKLEKLLERKSSKSSKSSEDSPIWPRRKKRRRLSVSRSGTRKQDIKKEPKPEEQQYISPTLIAEIFKYKISPEKLCELSTLKSGSPTAVRKIMPTASVEQICKVSKL